MPSDSDPLAPPPLDEVLRRCVEDDVCCGGGDLNTAGGRWEQGFGNETGPVFGFGGVAVCETPMEQRLTVLILLKQTAEIPYRFSVDEKAWRL